MTDETLADRATLPRPDVTAAEAGDILQSRYGLSGAITELGSQQDRNYRLDTGERSYVLKICHVTYETVELEAQNAAIRHIGTKEDAPRVPHVIPSTDGQDIVAVTVRDQTFQVRLLEYLEGEGLTGHRRCHRARPDLSGSTAGVS